MWTCEECWLLGSLHSRCSGLGWGTSFSCTMGVIFRAHCSSKTSALLLCVSDWILFFDFVLKLLPDIWSFFLVFLDDRALSGFLLTDYLLSTGCSSIIAGSGLEMIVQEVSRSSWSSGPLATGPGSCRPSVDSQLLNSTWSLPLLRWVPGLSVGTLNVIWVHIVAVVVWSWVHLMAVGAEKGVTGKD